MSELKYQVVEPMIELYVYDDKVVCYYNGCFKKAQRRNRFSNVLC